MMRFNVTFEEKEGRFNLSFGSVVLIERTDIPPEYGLVTYDQNKTITVT